MITLAEQLAWAERAAQRNRDYWNRRTAESRANPAYAAQQIRAGEAVVATLRQLAQDEAARG
jgi:hypothetical protein